MSARCSASQNATTSTALWLLASSLCAAALGCQSAPLRTTSRSTKVNQELPIRLVSASTSDSSKKPEFWQLQKTQREAAIRQAAADSKSKNTVRPASFEKDLWQNEEPPPLVNPEPNAIPECSVPDCSSDCDCSEICLRDDVEHCLPRLWDDAKSVLNWNNLLILGAAGGVAVGLREGHADHEVRQEIAEHPHRWGDGSQFLGKVGDVKYQAPVLLGLYGYSVWSQDEEMHDVMGTILSATVITGISTSTLKLVANTERPSKEWANGHYGFPSYHTASTFAIAAVLDEYYGCGIGLPAYAVAAAVGFSRLDEQDHDLSDVFFGGALGFVIGKAVAGKHLCGNSKIQFAPYFHPTNGTPGVACEVQF